MNCPELTLSVDTVTPVGGLALFHRNAGLLAEMRIQGGKRHSAMIMEVLDFLLKSAGTGLDEIDFITVTRGPGSFTGVRVGISTVKGLCFGLGKPVVAVSSLEAMAFSFQSFEGHICPLFDARKGEVYASLYTSGGGLLRGLIPEQAIRMEDLLPMITRKTLFAGDALEQYRDQILAGIGEKAVFPPPHLCRPLPSAVSLLGFEKARRGEFTDGAKLEPVYLRKSEAETGLERKMHSG